MKLLLDECVTGRLRRHITGHDVFTVAYMGWKGLSNGDLLAAAAAQGFEALLTTDRAVADQQNPATLPLAIVVMQARSNDITALLPLVPELLRTLNHLVPRSVAYVV